MSCRLDQPATMPKLKPTPKSPSSKKVARKRKRARERLYREAIRLSQRRPTAEDVARERLGL